MEVLMLLVPLSVLLVLGIGALFWWSVNSGQFDDLEGPAHRIVADDDRPDADHNLRSCALMSINSSKDEER
ncbi:MAG: cbb3-type cytochrome oxidase assembly protein CcoS [Burkholderiales bacterium]|nr:cbb3-type cytochrome oxidase assembly protein CcoS [Burkholderiales bacterium]